MKRRDFINAGILSVSGGVILGDKLIAGGIDSKPASAIHNAARNIIFLVSDGMSSGTLSMADLLLHHKEGRSSKWISLYKENRVRRALMETSSTNSLVTDSAAASSAWGGGKKVMNGSLNVNKDGSFNKPLLTKFKEAGKSVGCVTTVPVTHATPAGFCINSSNRSDQEGIASKYLSFDFDVLLGSGYRFFSEETRRDGKNITEEFRKRGCQVVRTKTGMENALTDKPLLGIFCNDVHPYALDHIADANLIREVPSIADMTRKALGVMCKNPGGFVLQVEGGKVDRAAHANDIAALLYDQLAFDEAVAIAIDFAEKNNDTLVVITSDHGNSNPGLLSSDMVNKKFDLLLNMKHTNDWILNGINKNFSVSQVIERVFEAQNIIITRDDAEGILSDYSSLGNDNIYNPYRLPFRKLASIQQKYTSVGWSGMDHSADYVELAMFGPGSEMLPSFIKNNELHNIMMASCGLEDIL